MSALFCCLHNRQRDGVVIYCLIGLDTAAYYQEGNYGCETG